MAILATTIANVVPRFWGSTKGHATLQDFMPHRATSPLIRPKQTPEQIKNVLMTLASQTGATIPKAS